MKFSPVLSVAALGFVLVGAACQRNVADLPARDHSQDGVITPVSLTTPSADARVDPRDLPVAKVAGKPMWAANKDHTAQENAQYQFEHHGTDFGSANVDAYVAKAHDFTGHPPSGAESLKRANGDTLIYDARENIFAVMSKEGAPRTLFKPADGKAYWAQQKQTLASAKDKAPRKAATKSAQSRSSQG